MVLRSSRTCHKIRLCPFVSLCEMNQETKWSSVSFFYFPFCSYFSCPGEVFVPHYARLTRQATLDSSRKCNTATRLTTCTLASHADILRLVLGEERVTSRSTSAWEGTCPCLSAGYTQFNRKTRLGYFRTSNQNFPILEPRVSPARARLRCWVAISSLS